MTNPLPMATAPGEAAILHELSAGIMEMATRYGHFFYSEGRGRMEKIYHYILITGEEELYNNITRQLAAADGNSDVVRVNTIEEAQAVMKKSGQGILLTDLRELQSGFRDSCAEAVELSPAKKQTETLIFGDDEEEFSGKGALRMKKQGKDNLKYIKMYIRLHLADDLSLTALSRLVCLSPNYMCMLFRESEGMSLGTFIEQSRMQRAAYLLITEDSQMQEIAARVGYRRVSYFCRAFKSYYGCTPRTYRYAHRAEEI